MIAIHKERNRLFIILIINIFAIFIYAEANNGLRQIAGKNIHATSVCIVEDSIDFVEDVNENYLPEFYGSQQNTLSTAVFPTIGQVSSKTMIDKALRIGLVRRHFPREKRIYDYYYTIFITAQVVWICSTSLFLCKFRHFHEIKTKDKKLIFSIPI